MSYSNFLWTANAQNISAFPSLSFVFYMHSPLDFALFW